MEAEGSLSHSQQSANYPYSEPDKSGLSPPTLVLVDPLMLSSPPCLDLRSGLFPAGFPAKTLYAALPIPMRTVCSAHLMLPLYPFALLLEITNSALQKCEICSGVPEILRNLLFPSIGYALKTEAVDSTDTLILANYMTSEVIRP